MYHNSPSRRGRRMSIDSPFLFAGNPYLAAAAGFPPGPPRPPPPPEMFFPYQNLMNGMAPHRANEIPVIQSVNGGLGHPVPMYPGFPTHPFAAHPPGDESLKHPADLSLPARSHGDGGFGEKDKDRSRDVDRELSPPAKRSRERSRSPFRPSPTSSSLPNGSADLSGGGTLTSTGELDLSMKTGNSSPPKSPPKPVYPPSPRLAYPPSPAHLSTASAKGPASGDRSSSGSPHPPPPPPPAPAPAAESSPENVMPSPTASWMWNTMSCQRCGQSFPNPAALEQHIQTQHLNSDTHPGSQAITA